MPFSSIKFEFFHLFRTSPRAARSKLLRVPFGERTKIFIAPKTAPASSQPPAANRSERQLERPKIIPFDFHFGVPEALPARPRAGSRLWLAAAAALAGRWRTGSGDGRKL